MPPTRRGVVFLLLFILVILAGAFIAALVQKILKEARLSWFDRLLGLFFGFIRGVVMDAVVIMAMLAFGIKVEAVRNSRLTPSVVHESHLMAAVMPADLRREYNAGLEDLKSRIGRD